MHHRRIFAAVLSVTVAVGSLCSGSWDSVLAEESTSDSQVEIYRRIPHTETGGMVHFSWEDSEGSDVSLPKGTKKSSLKQAVNLPSSYDPRGTDRETPIRNQEDTGACWTFGTMKTLETDCITKGILSAEQADLSENHLAWYTYHPLADETNPICGDYIDLAVFAELGKGESIDEACYAIGGNAYLAQFTLAKQWGAAWEEDAPFAEKEEMAQKMSEADDSLRYHSAIQLTDSGCYDPDPDSPFNESDRYAIKEAVLEHGAINVSLYYDTAVMRNNNGVFSSYSTNTRNKANHSVTIVGWDDSFNTFRTDAPAPGAWLIANSYGADYPGNEDGYFWVSYYDVSLCEFFTFEGVPGDTYENVFQYDGMGYDGLWVSGQDIKIANVFTGDSTQRLEAVSFYTEVDYQPYTIDIYRNLQGDNPKSGERVSRCRVSGTIAHAGYHTVNLTEPIAVAEGEKFSAIVTYYPVNGVTYVPTEGTSDVEYGFYYTGEKGQSYVYFAAEEKWYDNTEVADGKKIYNGNNVCIKVFSNPVSEEEYEEQQDSYVPDSPEPDPTKKPTPTPTATNKRETLSTIYPPVNPTDDAGTTVTSSPNVKVKISCKSKYIIGKGEKFTLPLNQSSVGGQPTLTFSTSNAKVAKVDKNGKITGKKTGTAKITINAISGAKKIVTIKVKKAPKKISVKGKKTLKKGKSTKLKVTLSSGSASYKIRYRSSNKKVATVNSAGKVTAKKKGTVKIYAYTFNNKKGSLKIKVK
ncbi:MAG: Ig-like domain-containing protein [Lachnospiraceae bacterium]|nr:Ig-like domain-containing protein [Lachnospiraceae bacterium]